ncbi:MAG: response regulator [Caloramator sp.]|nr:response regulator [Caloramator sp.]
MFVEKSKTKDILLVDDSNLIQVSLKEILQMEGYCVEAASNVDEAISAIKRKNGEYDLIILDVHLPNKNGFYLVKLLRDDEEFKNYKNVPIMMLTSDATVATVKKAIEIGVNDYLNKPFKTSEILKRVEKLITDKKETNYKILIDALQNEIERAKRGDYHLTVIIASCESEKDIKISEIIKNVSNSLRKVDTVLELGTSTFCSILPFTNLSGAQVVIDRIKEYLVGKWYVGISEYPSEAKDAFELYKMAKEKITREINQEINKIDEQKV